MARHTSSADITGATPVPHPLPAHEIAPPTREKAPARVRKKRRADTAPTDQAPDYEAIGVPPEIVPTVVEARLRYMEIGRLQTGQVYDFGAIIATVHDHAPDQKTFAKWAKVIFKLSRRGAENYVDVYRYLGQYRDRFVRLAVPASALYALSSGTPERVEEVVGLLENGRDLTVREITAMIATGDDAPVERGAETGGVTGLKGKIAEATSVAVPAFMDGLFEIQCDLHNALEPHRGGKRVDKGELKSKVLLPSRLARRRLETMTWVANSPGAPCPENVFHVMPVAREGRWHGVHQVLDRLGDFESWPSWGDLGIWLAETVVPALDWALGSRAQKAAADVEEMAKAAEAEKAKVEAEKAKAASEKAKVKAMEKRARLKTMKRDGSLKVAGAPKVKPETAVSKSATAKASVRSLAHAIMSGIGEAEKRARVRVAKAAALEAVGRESELPRESGSKRLPPSDGAAPGDVAPGTA